MRTKFKELFHTVAPLIACSIPSLEMLKSFLITHFPELKPQLDKAESLDNVLNAVKGMCTITNINYLERLIDHCNIEEAKAHITAYKLAVDKFCEEIKLSMCQNENFMKNPSSLPWSELQFLLDCRPDEHTLSDVMRLLEVFDTSISDELQLVKVECNGRVLVTFHIPRPADLFKKKFESELFLFH